MHVTNSLFSVHTPRLFSPNRVEVNPEIAPKVVEGEEVFGVAHLFASFNDMLSKLMLAPSSRVTLS